MATERVSQALLLAVVAIGLLWPVVGDHIQAAVTPGQAGCPHTSDLPRPENLAEARAAVLCLLNEQRLGRGLPPLVEDTTLQVAAQRHAENMGRRNFYAHRDPDGVAPDARIRAAGFTGGATGENIHWGVGIKATPARIVEDWMNSPGHTARTSCAAPSPGSAPASATTRPTDASHQERACT
jgi:uncharacterized protein YkwD